MVGLTQSQETRAREWPPIQVEWSPRLADRATPGLIFSIPNWHASQVSLLQPQAEVSLDDLLRYATVRNKMRAERIMPPGELFEAPFERSMVKWPDDP
jgi:hypothetical protein